MQTDKDPRELERSVERIVKTVPIPPAPGSFDGPVFHGAVAAIAAIGPPAIPLLCRISATEVARRNLINRVFEEMRRRHDLAAIEDHALSVMRSTLPGHRDAAVGLLKEVATSRAIEPLMHLLNASNGDVRRDAACVLFQRVGCVDCPPQLPDELIKAIQNVKTSYEADARILAVLTRVGGVVTDIRPVVTYYAQWRLDPDYDFRRKEALNALRKIRCRDALPLIEMVETSPTGHAAMNVLVEWIKSDPELFTDAHLQRILALPDVKEYVTAYGTRADEGTVWEAISTATLKGLAEQVLAR